MSANERPNFSTLLAVVPKPCGVRECNNVIAGDDRHPYCIACLGVSHAIAALAPPSRAPGVSCPACLSYDAATLNGRFDLASASAGSFSALSGRARPDPSAPGPSGLLTAPRPGVQPAAVPPGGDTNGPGARPNVAAPRDQAPGPSLSPTGSAAAVPRKRPCLPTTANPLPGAASQSVVRALPFDNIQQGGSPHSPSAIASSSAGRAESERSWHASDGDIHDVDAAEDQRVSEDDESENEVEDQDEGEELSSFQQPPTQADDTVMASPRAEAASPSSVTTAPSSSLPPTMPAEGEGGATPGGESFNFDELTIFERASVRCGIEVPIPNNPAGQEGEIRVLGQDPAPAPPPRMVKLPVVPGFQSALHSTWADHKDPKKLDFLIDCVDAESIGIPLCPNMDSLLAQSFMASIKPEHRKSGPNGRPPFNLATVKKPPGFAIPEDDSHSGKTRNSYRCAALAARDLNANQLLLTSAKLLVEGLDGVPAETAAELQKTFKMLIDINVHAIKWMGHGMDYAIQSERARWLDKVDLVGSSERETHKVMQALPGHPTTLMGGGLELLRGTVESRKATKEILEATTESKPANEERGRSSRGRQSDRSRSASARVKNYPPPPRAPSYSGGARPRSKVVVPNREDNRPPPKDTRPPPSSSYKARGRGKRK